MSETRGSDVDDPREILKVAGVECAEVDEYTSERFESPEPTYTMIRQSVADAAILALARLVAGQATELKKQETFIALLKGMVEQLEGDKFEGYGYDLQDLRRRMAASEQP